MNNDIRERLQDTAHAIEAHLPPGTGFILLAFDFGNSPLRRLEYVSNGHRDDCLKLMQEYIDKRRNAPWAVHEDDGPMPPGLS